jgi:ABC-2 type transport system permease protein
MKNTWLVAKKEFVHRVRNRGFILSSIAVPLIMILIWAGTGLFDMDLEAPDQREIDLPDPVFSLIGYVDLADYIHSVPVDLPQDLFQEFPDISAANQALQFGEIEVYYLIPPEYLESTVVRRVSMDLPLGLPPDIQLFNIVLVSNLFPEASPDELARIRYPLGAPRLQFVSIEVQDSTSQIEPGNGEDPRSEEEPGLDSISMTAPIMPMLVTIIIIIPLFTSGGYLLQSLAQEKSNRVMEILLLSLRPRQLLAGKLLGFGALTLVQYGIWIAFAGLALTLTGQDVPELLAEINLSFLEVLYLILFALGGYALYSAFMAGIGALAPNIEGGRSWVLLIAMPMFIPIYFWVFIVNAPNGVLAVTLSLIPFSAPVAMLMRLTATTVPGWQIALSLALLGLTSYGIIRLMARMFQVQALLSGEAISLRRIWYVLKNS